MKKTQFGSCNFAGCERDKKSRGLCQAHYMQMHAGRPLTALKTYVLAHKDENGRVCVGCKHYKPWDNFYTHSNGYHWSKCKPCVVAENQERNKKYVNQ